MVVDTAPRVSSSLRWTAIASVVYFVMSFVPIGNQGDWAEQMLSRQTTSTHRGRPAGGSHLTRPALIGLIDVAAIGELSEGVVGWHELGWAGQLRSG
jgi:hypothetical protein